MLAYKGTQLSSQKSISICWISHVAGGVVINLGQVSLHLCHVEGSIWPLCSSVCGMKRRKSTNFFLFFSDRLETHYCQSEFTRFCDLSNLPTAHTATNKAFVRIRLNNIFFYTITYKYKYNCWTQDGSSLAVMSSVRVKCSVLAQSQIPTLVLINAGHLVLKIISFCIGAALKHFFPLGASEKAAHHSKHSTKQYT